MSHTSGIQSSVIQAKRSKSNIVFESEIGGLVPQCDASRKEFNRKRGYIEQSVNREVALKQKGIKHGQDPVRHFQRTRATSCFVAIRSVATTCLRTGRPSLQHSLRALYVTATNRHVLLHSIKAYGKRNTGTAPLILNLGTRWREWSVRRPARTTSVQGPICTL